jgi:hypothetical protein
MAHMLKNTVFKSAGYALTIPTGSSSISPEHPVAGQTRYNVTTAKLEFYNNSRWNAVAREGNVTIAKDSFTGDGVKTDFGPMSANYSAGAEAQVLVHVGTVYQTPGTNYTFYGNAQIHFSSAPSLGSEVVIIHGLASTTAG